MTQPVPSPSTEKEAQLQRHLERGADTSMQTRRRYPVSATIDSTEPVVVRVPGTKEASPGDAAMHLTLRVTHSRSLDFAVLIYINTPDATAESSAEAPGFVGTMAFIAHSEHHPGTGSAIRLPVTEQLRRTRKEEDITVTIVPMAYPGRETKGGKFRVSAAIELVDAKVTPR